MLSKKTVFSVIFKFYEFASGKTFRNADLINIMNFGIEDTYFKLAR